MENINMQLVYEVDSTTGLFVETHYVDVNDPNLPSNYIQVGWPDGQYEPHYWDFTNKVWYSGKSDTEILDMRRALKIKELKLACAAAIYEGFTSTLTASDGTALQFGFNDHDQKNFNSRTNRVNQWVSALNAGQMTQTEFDAKFPLKWKTKNKGIVDLSYSDFLILLDDADVAFMTKQQKYWELEAQAYAAQSQTELDAVLW